MVKRGSSINHWEQTSRSYTRTDRSHALGMLVVPAFFMLGCMLSAELVEIRLRRLKRPKYFLTFGVVFFLSFTCGVQNGTITTVSRSVIRTTHLTGVTTDLGIGIVRYLHRKSLNIEIQNEVRANLMRLGIILFFGLGSVVGGFVFTKFGYAAFAIPVITSGVLFVLMLYFQVLKYRET